MNQEIERKFLVKDHSFKEKAHSFSKIKQWYISSAPERTVRVRLEEFKDNSNLNIGYLTIKVDIDKNVVSRYEWETELEYEDAQNLIKLCEPGVVEKIRYRFNTDSHIFEIDEFLGKNKGLIIAEIELSYEDEEFEKPSWLGEEVTGNQKYYNLNLK